MLSFLRWLWRPAKKSETLFDRMKRKEEEYYQAMKPTLDEELAERQAEYERGLAEQLEIDRADRNWEREP